MNFGVVGTGFITDLFIDAARKDPRCKIIAVCSRSLDKAKAYAAKFCIPNSYCDFDEMCGSSLINTVYIGAPNYMHYELAMTAMKHSLNVLCEKPFASNYEEAEKMINFAKKKNVAIMEAMRLTPSPVFQAIKNNLSKCGKIHNTKA